jgi:predicted RNA-binding Zn ribbon-like protein
MRETQLLALALELMPRGAAFGTSRPTAPSLAAAQATGFVLGGEPLALDLVDTLADTDLLSDPRRNEAFWRLQARRLPRDARTPTLANTRALRQAIRALFEAHLAQREPPPAALELVNRSARRVTTSAYLVASDGGWRELTTMHFWRPENMALAAAAVSAMHVLTRAANRLRSCANPSCNMLFLADTARRQWCAPNVCGNRVRVARHYQRTREVDHPAQSPSSGGDADLAGGGT